LSNMEDVITVEDLRFLLQTNTRIFAVLHDLDLTLELIAEAAQALLNAERSTVWVLDPADELRQTLYAKVFETANPLRENLNSSSIRLSDVRRINVNSSLAGWVTRNEQLLNIEDAYQDQRFNPEVDQLTGFKTKAVLAVPIFSNTLKEQNTMSLELDKNILFNSQLQTPGEIQLIGVLQLLNKKVGSTFSKHDECLAILFAEYIGIALNNCINFQKLRHATLRARVIMDIMTYHYKIEDSAIQSLLEKIDSTEFLEKIAQNNITNLTFSPRVMEESDTIALVMFMFEDLGILERFRMDRKNFARYVLMVHHSYRSEVPYHNWKHAISAAHFAYLLIKHCNLNRFLTQVQIDSLPLAMLTHDVDHRGTNNAFQGVSKSNLAALYSSEGSILERHHLAQTMYLLYECKLMDNLDDETYDQVTSLIQHVILATDLALYFKDKPAIDNLQRSYNNCNPSHQKLLLSLLTTSCDLSQVTKTQEMSLQICDLIFQEFFAQGDREKAFGRTVIPMMDRERANIAKEQINFLESIALPTFKSLMTIIPEAQPFYDKVLQLREYWLTKLDQ